jgi:hypothetical protein
MEATLLRPLPTWSIDSFVGRFAKRPANNRPFAGLALEGSLFANPLFSRLPVVGIEPTRHCWQRILSSTSRERRVWLGARFLR